MTKKLLIVVGVITLGAGEFFADIAFDVNDDMKKWEHSKQIYYIGMYEEALEAWDKMRYTPMVCIRTESEGMVSR